MGEGEYMMTEFSFWGVSWFKNVQIFLLENKRKTLRKSRFAV